MKTLYFSHKLSLCLLAIFVCLPIMCCHAQMPTLLNPSVKLGKVLISGKVTVQNKTKLDKPIPLIFSIPHSITGDVERIDISTDLLGNYSVEIETETDPCLGAVNLTIGDDYETVYFELPQSKEMKLNFIYTNEQKLKVISSSQKYLSTNEMLLGSNIFSKVLASDSNIKKPWFFDKEPEVFLNYAKQVINAKLALLNGEPLISNSFRTYLANELLLCINANYVFDYNGSASLNQLNYLKGDSLRKKIVIKDPTLSYYSFLKDCKLNSNKQLITYSFPSLQNEIFLNDTLNIPAIKNLPIADWQQLVKKKMAALLGFDQGLYYDILTANAYACQILMKNELLSDKQKENIHSYFKGNEIEKILLRKNNRMANPISASEPSVICECPAVDDADFMDAILQKYKGKPVVVDFWYTSCPPCLAALKDAKSVALAMKDQPVVHVYLSYTGSPRSLWEKRIQQAGGQHYYLSNKTWSYLFNKYNLEACPSFLIFDKNGALKKKAVGYENVEYMVNLLKEALK